MSRKVTPPTKKGPGRPPKEVDEALLFEYARQKLSKTDAGRLLGISDETINKKYLAIWNKGCATRRLQLRQAQTKSALEDRVPSLLIFLGKNELDQSDKQDHTVGSPDGGPLTVKLVYEKKDTPDGPPGPKDPSE